MSEPVGSGQRTFHRASNKARTKKREEIGAKMGRMTKVEREAIIEVAARAPESIDVQRMSQIMHRSPEAIKEMVLVARQKLQERAGEYADIHLEAAKRALENDDPDTARKAAEFILTRVGEGDARVLDGDASQTQAGGPIIQIGFKVGGDK
jgi:acyl-CoA reductase-like NAD-dependent aldehyde dehydrogenase